MNNKRSLNLTESVIEILRVSNSLDSRYYDYERARKKVTKIIKSLLIREREIVKNEITTKILNKI